MNRSDKTNQDRRKNLNEPPKAKRTDQIEPTKTDHPRKHPPEQGHEDDEYLIQEHKEFHQPAVSRTTTNSSSRLFQ